jgi:glyoxylase-like metal-dependent hydrolase (beta-lactamase superfamily II)
VPLAESVTVLQGWECNNPVSAGDDGIVLVDTCGEKVAERLVAAAQRLSPKPLRFVINTHAHGDHTRGNAIVQKLAPVIAHHAVRTRLAAGNEKTGDKPAAPEALPIVTFDDEMTLHLNGEEIRLLHVPPGHTDGDTVVFFKKANVVSMGDVFIAPAASFGDRHFGGGMLPLINALEFVLPQIPADAKIVPGHGAISTRADVVRGREVLKEMKALVEAGVKKGRTLEQIQAERPFDKFRESVPPWSSSDKSLNGWVKDFYRELAPKPDAPK